MAIAIAPGVLPSAVAPPIVVTEARLGQLPWLVDVARDLRSRVRCMFAVSVAYNAVLVPAALLGVLSPLAAAGAAMAETLVILLVATYSSSVAPTHQPFGATFDRATAV